MGPKSNPLSTIAPVGGWNTRDALDGMPATDAVLLDNWFPDVGKVRVRPGYTEHSTGMGSGNVDTIAEFHSGSTRKLIACANGNIYDATSGTASSLKSGFTVNNWQTQSFRGRLFLVNGTDAPQDYDGSTVSATSWTGPTLTDLIGVKVFKSRLYFIEKNSQSFWYGAASGVSGTLTEFDLSVTNQFGGTLLAMAVWTFDGGAGIDDYAVFLMSSGEVIVYQGKDPGSDFALVGYYHIGIPISNRAVIEVGGDVLIATTNDYVRLSEVLQTGQLGGASKLSGAMISASENSSLFGWQTVIHRKGSMIVSNVPNADGTYYQHVFNATTGAACRFTGIPARCWGVYNDNLYFGSTDGAIYQITGNDDGGANITATAKGSWNNFQTPVRKRVTAARPVLETNGGIGFSFVVAFDFRDSQIPAPSVISGQGAQWDQAEWDQEYWAGTDINTQWRVAGGMGQSISPNLSVSSKNSIAWYRTDYRIEGGRNL